MDILQECRRAVLMPLVGEGMSGVEIGAFVRPTVLPSEARMQFADYYSTEQLREQARELKIDADDVVEVTHVVRDTSLENVLPEPVDFIIANHVVEHLIDPFRWIKSMERLLKPGGFLFITLPDKKFSFDKFRPDTSLSHFLGDMLSGGESSLQEHCIEAGLLYDHGYIKKPQDAEQRLTTDAIEGFTKAWHPGVHIHVFQPEAFRDRVLQPLLHLGHLDYSLESYVNHPRIGEFSFVLRKGTSQCGWDPNAIYTTSYDSQIAAETPAAEPVAPNTVSPPELPIRLRQGVPLFVSRSARHLLTRFRGCLSVLHSR